MLKALSISGNPLLTLRKAMTGLPFPEAPFEANGLIPITSPEQLAQSARELENCLVDHDQFYSSCIDVQSGIAFYFRTMEAGGLLLRFTRIGRLGWYLDECRGHQNRRPSVQ